MKVMILMKLKYVQLQVGQWLIDQATPLRGVAREREVRT